MSHRGPVIAFLVGCLCAGSAFAGVFVRGASDPSPDAVVAGDGGTSAPGPSVASHRAIRWAQADVGAPSGARRSGGRWLAGAARVSLRPAPRAFGGARWQTSGCTDVDAGHLDQDHVLPDVDPGDPVGSVDDIRSWPASSPDCIYLGGYGIGPVRPAEKVGPGGVWVRAMALSNGQDTFVYAIADVVGWFARYDSTICDDCGVLDVRQRIAADTGLDVDEVVVASTHTHAGADTYGGWGGLPDWYRNQIRDATIAAVKRAISALAPAKLRTGEIHLRRFNNERRDTYYSTVDTGATWVQARSASGRVLATLAAYAAHPTIVEAQVLHADWPGAAARSFESRFGGVGLVFAGGLGNASISTVSDDGDPDVVVAEKTGRALAGVVAGSILRAGIRLRSNEMATAVQRISHPVTTNPGLVTLATVGLFDREFTPATEGSGVPGSYYWSKSGEASTSGDVSVAPQGSSVRGCSSTGPTVQTAAGAHRLGELIIAFAPGEIFSNISEVVKERADRSAVTMVLGQANDALGYIIQSFEFDTAGAGAAGEYGTQHGEYEEVFAIDRCFGDHVLQTILESTASLGAGG